MAVHETMILEMHPAVKLVAEFMQRNVQAKDLCGVANALAMVAPAMWGRHTQSSEEEIWPLGLNAKPIS